MAPEAVRASLIIAAAAAGTAFLALLVLLLSVAVLSAGDDGSMVWTLHGTTLAVTGAGAVACIWAWRRRRPAKKRAPASTGANLVLAGAVLHTLTVPMFAVYGTWPGMMSLLPEEGASPWVPVVLLGIFVAFVAVPAAGAAMGFVAYGQARRGAGRPKTLAIVSSLLPPQVVTLLGALLMRRDAKP